MGRDGRARCSNALTLFAITFFAELSWEQLGGKLDSELHAAFLITKAVVPGMVSRGSGRLIYLSTGLSRRAREGMITLGTAKAALDQFVRYIALEVGTSRDHRQPRRTGHGGGNQGDRAVHSRADARVGRGHADATAAPSRGYRQGRGVPGK